MVKGPAASAAAPISLGDLILKSRLFLKLTKPRQLSLLMATMYGAYFAGGGPLDLERLLLLTIMGFSSIGGVTAFNMYFDIDIDSAMRRTRKRPLPSKALTPGEALLGSMALILVGSVAAYAINVYVFLAVISGLFFDIIAYTQLTKRFTPISIIVGSIAGSMPALGGWAAATGSITLGGLLLALVVFLWQPMHVWFLAYYFKEDYEKARVPVLPDDDPKVVATLIGMSITALPFTIWAFALVYGFGYISAIIASLLALISLARMRHFVETGDKRDALKLFKFASPIIAVVFFLLPLERAATMYLVLQVFS